MSLVTIVSSYSALNISSPPGICFVPSMVLHSNIWVASSASLRHFLGPIASQTSHSVTTAVSIVHGCFFSYGSLPACSDHHILLSDLSSCPHCTAVSVPASKSATFASSSSFNQHFSPHGQPQPVVYCTLMSRESRARPSLRSHCSSISSSSHHRRVGVHAAELQENTALCRTSRRGRECLRRLLKCHPSFRTLFFNS